MHKALVYIIPTLLLFSAHGALAKTLYTWTDKNGIVHITESKPPAGAQQADKVTYKVKPKKETPQVEDRHVSQQRALMLEYDARRKAQRLRREADNAKKAMDAAIEEANRMKAETDAYIQQWGLWARYRKSARAQIRRKQEATNQVVAEADRLRTIAAEAEAKAQAAEKQVNDLTQLSREPSDDIRAGESEASPPLN